MLHAAHGPFHLTRCFGKDFVCLVFGDGPLPEAVTELTAQGIAVLDIPPETDSLGQAEGLVLVRPDGYVMGRWRGFDPAALLWTR